MKKKLPIGIQTFEEIRTENYYYVDKTAYIPKLVNSGKFYFLSRPRRFGKSLFLDTIKQAFLGRKELFQGLFLENNWDWNQNYPVIHISFGRGKFTTYESFVISLQEIFMDIERDHQIKLEYPSFSGKLWEAIRVISKRSGKKVVVLVDEYDKPILECLTDSQTARQNREELKSLYTVLKEADPYLKFVFLTGVSKFSKVSLFSGLNQLKDITLDENYSTICGYTEEELMEVFQPELEGENIDRIRDWYNGYSFCGKKVYNPFDVLLYFSERKFKSYWFETATPEFLVKLLLEKRFFVPQLEEVVATERLIGNFNIDHIEPEAILFQTGYLTIKSFNSTSEMGTVYFLSYPNKEVKISLNEHILAYYTSADGKIERITPTLRDAFAKSNLEALKKLLHSLFASIPSDWYRKNKLSGYEGYYSSVVYSFFVASGLTLIPEDTTNTGRIDLTVIYADKVYIIEFKVLEIDKEEGSAIEQIERKRYYEKYLGKYTDIYLLGVEFSSETKNIHNFQWKKLVIKQS